MPKLTDTYALAYEACDRVLTETAKFPTIDSIRERIGVNSPATIKRAINDWTLAFAHKHVETLHHPALPAALVDACDSLWRLAVREAQQALKQEREALSQERQTWVERQTTAEATIEALETTLQRQQSDLNAKAEEMTALKHEITAQKTRLDACRQEFLTLQATYEQRELQGQREREQADARQRDQEAWFQRRIVEERELAAGKAQDELRHLRALNEVLETARKQGVQQLQHGHAQTQELRAQVKSLESELATRPPVAPPKAKPKPKEKAAQKRVAAVKKKRAPSGGEGERHD